MARRNRRVKVQLGVEALEGRALMSTYGVVLKGVSAWWVSPNSSTCDIISFPGAGLGRPRGPNLNQTEPRPSPCPTGSSHRTGVFLTNYPDGIYQVSYQGTATLDFEGIGKNNGPFTLGSDGYYHGSITINHSWYNDESLVLHATGLDASPTRWQSQHHHSRV